MRNVSSSNAPSGIAQQLQKSSEQEQDYSSQVDLMNIDDFIFSDSAATPLASHAETPRPANFAPDNMQGITTSHPHAHSSAIPIKSRKDSQQRFTPQSVPFPPRHQGEFNYVARHVRKTSIDDRRVSQFCIVLCRFPKLLIFLNGCRNRRSLYFCLALCPFLPRTSFSSP